MTLPINFNSHENNAHEESTKDKFANLLIYRIADYI